MGRRAYYMLLMYVQKHIEEIKNRSQSDSVEYFLVINSFFRSIIKTIIAGKFSFQILFTIDTIVLKFDGFRHVSGLNSIA